MKGYAFITGASSGFGEAIAESLAKEGFQLIIAARRTERLIALKERLSGLCSNIHILSMDVRQEAAVQDAISSLPTEVKNHIEISFWPDMKSIFKLSELLDKSQIKTI